MNENLDKQGQKCVIFDFGGVISNGLFGAIMPGIKEVIVNLSKTHLLFVVSSSYSSTIVHFLTKHGIRNCFEEVFGFDDNSNKTEKILEILKSFQIDSSKTVMITDTTQDVESANNAGIKVIGVLWGAHNQKALEGAGVDLVVDSPKLLIESVDSLTDNVK
ncbi:MAG: HAD family hydrolase [Candidatus Magasanikbacteria bacterium]